VCAVTQYSFLSFVPVNYIKVQSFNVGRGSSVCIVNRYRLDGPGIESRGEARFSAAVQTGPGAHPASCTMGTGYFLKVKSGRGVALIPHLLLVPWSKKSRAIPLLPLWAVRPVQSLIACTRVHFTLLYSTLLYFTLLYYKEVKDHSHCVLCTLGKRT